MRIKRILLVLAVILLTVGSYIFMNRNYDPLARYPYKNRKARTAILTKLDEREIKYIVDYSIAPEEFMEFIDNPSFNAYNISLYSKAKNYLYNLNSYQIVTIVEGIKDKGLDFDTCMNSYMYLTYEDMLLNLKLD